MHVVLLGALRGQHEGLHEPPHRLAVVGQLTGYLKMAMSYELRAMSYELFPLIGEDIIIKHLKSLLNSG